MAGGGFDAPESGSSGLHKQKKYKKGKKIGVRIDMTPMVDVIMLLLTFFILTTTPQSGWSDSNHLCSLNLATTSNGT